MIVVDNPLFADYLGQELKGSGTLVKFGNDHEIISKTGESLLINLSLLLNAIESTSNRKSISDFKEGKEDKEDKEKYPKKLVSCCNQKCQILSDENMKKCSVCKLVYYCSVDCQKQDWENHKKIC